ncbi:VOC family protein [Mariniblastus fucicola]|uniref:Fosfomycin resistance protein FosB n=1 Tax=Mariniblastus fucicola TaxID=980251 RepID=A0A5B9PC34_9BACT|nr:VOC family protein [Mariniblastus fucicola]QEG22482.1 fosfomycin resistance protein FosB [Mariniblastus fucicola]
MSERPTITGMRHVSLNFSNFDATLTFYTEVLGMQVEWQPDADNVFLTSGDDNFALQRRTDVENDESETRLDHIGFFVSNAAEVDRWHDFMKQADIAIERKPKTHRDGSRSFFVRDPDGTLIQMLYHPPRVSQLG